MTWAKRVRLVAWVCFALMWIPLAFVIWTGITEGDAAFMDMMMVPFIALSILFAVLFVGSFGIGWVEKEDIKKRGTPASATIVSVSDTGTLINNQPMLRIDLEVQPPYDSRFTATVEYVVPFSALPRIQPGEKVRVYYIPGTTEVAIADL